MHRYRPIRPYSQQVQRKTGPRSPRKLALVQILGLLMMLCFAAATIGVVTVPNFEAATVEIHGERFTGGDIVRSILGLDHSQNVFRIQTDRAAQLLARLPAVEWASVEVQLPSTVVVTLQERTARMIWVVGSTRYVVDQDGVMFGLVDLAGNPILSNAGPLATTNPDLASPTPTPIGSGDISLSGSPSDSSGSASPSATSTPEPTPTPEPSRTPGKTAKATPTKAGKAKVTPTPAPTPTPTPTIDPSLLPSIEPVPVPPASASPGPLAESLPTVYDRRSSDAGLKLGDAIDPVNLDAGYRLAGLTPTDVGSAATSLGVVVDDQHGFTISPEPPSWVAEFGFYAPTVRKTSVIPDQVRDLRSAIAKWGEDHIAWVRLVADVSENCSNTVIRR